MVQVEVLPETPNLIVSLSEITRSQIGTVGSKAANLGEMLQAGFPVPEGFVLTTIAFESFMTSNGLDDESSYDEVLNALMPTYIEDQLQAVFIPFNSFTCAVRSSGVAEDLADASFAGQYETVLNVQGFDELSKAIRRCWASAFSERVSAYRAEKGKLMSRSMAVLVQRLVYADAAGVAFSANPVTGDRDECVINAVKGLGESLVSGHTTPDEWVINGNDAKSLSSPENAITVAQALTLADMAKQAESHFGEPQDIEWAIKDNELFLLQARPITALPEYVKPVPIPISPPPGNWVRETEHCPDPLSPLFSSTILPLHEKGITVAMEEYSILIEGVQFRNIGGWLYTKLIPLGGKERSPPPEWIASIITPIMIRLVPSIRKRVNGLVNVVKTDLPSRNIERWYTEWKPNNNKKIDQFKSVDLTSLSDDELKQHLNDLLTFQAECSRIHARLTGADMLVADFILTAQKILGWNESKCLELLSGLSFTTTEPTKRLGELAQIAKKNPVVSKMLESINSETAKKIAEVDHEFATAFEKYIKEFGVRTLCWELNKETLEERPDFVLQLVHNQIENNYDFDSEAESLRKNREKLLMEVNDILTSKSKDEQEELKTTLKKAERAYPTREDHEYYLHITPLALFRKAFLEIGKRLQDQEKLKQKDDIFFLELNEVKDTFTNKLDKRQTVKRRKGELAWALENPGPISYGGPSPPPPSLKGFPPEVRRVMEGMLWMIEGNASIEYLQEKVNASAEKISGIPASAGHYTGPARIIMSDEDFHKLQPGDVLVCPTTQPPWSVIFPSVGALVTDGGGILSHPAIIAREYHIPAIVATSNATSKLQDDQIITVNGDTGQVIIVE